MGSESRNRLCKESMKVPKRLLLIDGSSYIYRAYHAIRHLSTSRGLPTNATYGFTSMILKVIKDYQPAYLAIAFDAKGPTFREEMYKEYKANRPEMESELVVQLPYIKEIVEAFNIPSIEQSGYEADDLIGTIARQAEEQGLDTVIITGDKDMMQLVSDKVTLYDTMKNKKTGKEEVKERFAVIPERVIDIFGLMGDKTDNIPGVPGIGKKTAIELIKEFHTLEDLLGKVSKVKKEKLRESLINFTEQARLSKKLATIDTRVPLKARPEQFKYQEPDIEKLRVIFTELEFSKFLKELTPAKKISYEDYHLICTQPDFERILTELSQVEEFALDLETTGKDPMQAEMVGLSFSYKEHQAFYIPLAHDYPDVPEQLPRADVLKALKPVLENSKIKKIGQNIKYDLIILKRYGINLAGCLHDVMLASYLLNPAKHNHNLEEIVRDYLEHQMITYEEVAGKGQKQVSFDKVDLKTAGVYAAEDADATFLLYHILMPKLVEHNLLDLYERLETLLIRVLAKMEINGIKIDKEILKELSDDFGLRLDRIKRDIYKLAGEEFNLDSPKQLQVILYEKLGLKPGKKIKTGFSTDSETLSRLAREKKHPLPANLLEYRTLTKLKSTYIDALALLINPTTGRIHTFYNQTVTATGRLSSSEPNLQNIPIRTEEGRKIRQAFIPEKGYIFISADYSQIELRVLAHFSKDPGLIEAFSKNEDIHSHTAMEIFGVSQDMISTDMRRSAKVINFGIIYGMSNYGLSQQLGISPEMAQEYIDNYFERYGAVRLYFEDTLTQAREQGYVTTLLGRRRTIPELKSSNHTVRSFAERAAINAPIQGTAADIMKQAMINIHTRLAESGLQTKMVLQVHDELLFEVPHSEEDKIIRLVSKEMESVMELNVPLKVDISRGKNWAEMSRVG